MNLENDPSGKSIKTTLLHLGLLAAVATLFFHRVFSPDTRLGGDDLNHLFIPWKSYLLEWIGKGVLPFWNPYSFCGAPFLHNIQVSAFYPFDLIHLILPFPWSYGIAYYLHFCVAGFGAYWLFGEFISNRTARFYSSLLYLLSGFIVSRLEAGIPLMVYGYCWTPYFFLAGKRTFELPTPRRAGCLAVLTALLAVCGHPQFPFLLVQFFGAYCLFESVRLWKSGYRLKGLAIRFGTIAGAGLLGFLISLPQSGPFLEFAGYSATRGGGADYDFSAHGSLPWRHLLMLFFPFLFGDPTQLTFWGQHMSIMETCAYLGTFAILLVAVGLFLPKKRYFYFWLGAGLVALLVSVGDHAPFHKILYTSIPGWDRFRNPGRTLYIYSFAGCLLAGYGLDALIRLQGEEVKRRLRLIAIMTGTLALCLALGAINVAAMKETILKYFIASETSLLFEETGSPGPVIPLSRYEHRYASILSALVVATAYTSGFTLLLLLWWRNEKWRPGLMWIVIAVTAFDLYVFGYRFFPVQTEAVWKKQFCQDTGALSFLKEEGYGGRVLIPDDTLDWRMRSNHPEIFPNGPTLFRVPQIRGYNSSILKHYSEFINRMQGRPADTFPGGLLFLENVAKMDPFALRVMGARTLLAYEKPPSYFKPVKRFETGLLLFENPDALPRAFRAQPSENVWGLEPLADAAGMTRVEEETPNRIVVDTEGETAATLVFADCYFPGWKATLDGREIPIEPAFHAFQSVQVPRGESRVIWDFRPSHWSLYLVVSGVCGLLVLCLLVWPPRARQSAPSVSTRNKRNF